MDRAVQSVNIPVSCFNFSQTGILDTESLVWLYAYFHVYHIAFSESEKWILNDT